LLWTEKRKKSGWDLIPKPYQNIFNNYYLIAANYRCGFPQSESSRKKERKKEFSLPSVYLPFSFSFDSASLETLLFPTVRVTPRYDASKVLVKAFSSRPGDYVFVRCFAVSGCSRSLSLFSVCKTPVDPVEVASSFPKARGPLFTTGSLLNLVLSWVFFTVFFFLRVSVFPLLKILEIEINHFKLKNYNFN